MKNFNELRNEINEAKKKKPCTDCGKKPNELSIAAAAKVTAKRKAKAAAGESTEAKSTAQAAAKAAAREAREAREAAKEAYLADQQKIGPKSGNYRID